MYIFKFYAHTNGDIIKFDKAERHL